MNYVVQTSSSCAHLNWVLVRGWSSTGRILLLMFWTERLEGRRPSLCCRDGDSSLWLKLGTQWLETCLDLKRPETQVGLQIWDSIYLFIGTLTFRKCLTSWMLFPPLLSTLTLHIWCMATDDCNDCNVKVNISVYGWLAAYTERKRLIQPATLA